MAHTHRLQTRAALAASTMLIALAASAGLATRAGATPVSGSSSAYGEGAALTVTALIGGAVVNVGSGPLPTVSGTAPAAYSQTGTAASASISGLLSTGVLNVSASSNVSGLPGTGLTQASATVNNLGINLASLLGITAGTVVSSASVQGDYGSLAAAGSTTITGLSIAGLAAFGAVITPAANTIVLNAGGIEITLNKEVSTLVAGVPTITVDAIAVDFTDVLATVAGTLGHLNGELDIAQSSATMAAVPNAVPEPGGLVVLGMGLAGLVLARRKMVNCST